jgi:hypothetical protein
MIKKILSFFCLIIYFLYASTFFHVQAMWIDEAQDMEGDCFMHKSMDISSLPINNGCYEKCLGIYNDFSLWDSTEKKINVDQPCLTPESNFLKEKVTTEQNTFYRNILDGWWGINISTPKYYNKAIKKIE